MCEVKTKIYESDTKKRTSKTPPLDTLELTSEFDLKSNAKKTLQLRRNAKALSTSINGQLCYVDSAIHKDYQAAYFCNTYLFQNGNRLVSSYCKKRSCIVCSRIMAARLFKSYAEPLLNLKGLHMVTLTAPTVEANQLNKEIKKRYDIITRIKDNIRKTHKIKLRGFRKLEITHNSRTQKFHPHYHLLVESEEAATLMRDYWLKLIPEADKKAQHIRQVKDNKGLLEVFKYVTKPITKDTFDKVALDHIYTSLKGIRTYQSFGIKKTQEVKIDKYESLIISHKSERIDVWKWCKESHDWYDSSGEQLNTGEIDKKVKKALKTINNTSNEEQQRPQAQTHHYQSCGGIKRPQRSRKEAIFDD